MLCQRCRLPLQPHDSLLNLTPTQRGLLTADQQSDKRPTFVPNNYKFHSPTDSFVYLTDSLLAGQSTVFPAVAQASKSGGNSSLDPAGATTSTAANKPNFGQRDNRSKRIQTVENLFDNISGKSDLDYPICVECADLVLEGLKPRYEEACKERDIYVAFLNKIRDTPSAGSEEIKDLELTISKLKTDNELSLKDLEAAEEELRQAEEELEALKTESAKLEIEESAFYQKANETMGDLEHLRLEKEQLDTSEATLKAQIQRLERANVFNDTFFIGSDSHFGTINGLRLGRLRDKRVEWSEINAAWGQLLLLLSTIITRLNIKIQGYRLRPLGSTSRIEQLPTQEADMTTDGPGAPSKPIVLELYSSGDYTFERILNHKRIDSAMVAFLDVLDQVCQFISQANPPPTQPMPYKIDKDKIGGHSIRLSLKSTNESWTMACKHVLGTAKWALAQTARLAK